MLGDQKSGNNIISTHALTEGDLFGDVPKTPEDLFQLTPSRRATSGLI